MKKIMFFTLLALNYIQAMELTKAEEEYLAIVSFFEVADKRNAEKWRTYIHNPKAYKGNRPGHDRKIVDPMFEAALKVGLLTSTFTIPTEISNLVNAGKLN